MAQGKESTLSLGIDEFRTAVIDFLGMGRTYSSTSSAEQTWVDEIINDAYRRALYPDSVDGRPPHVWSFLYARYPFNTISSVEEYDMPDRFDGFRGCLTYSGNDYPVWRVEQRSPEQVEELISRAPTTQGKPEYFAVYPVSEGAGTSVHRTRYRLRLWRIPDGAYPLQGWMRLAADKLDTNHPYPLGGLRFAELLREACLAEAEVKRGDNLTDHNQLYLQKLKTAVDHDRQFETSDHLGENASVNDGVNRYRVNEISYTNAWTGASSP